MEGKEGSKEQDQEEEGNTNGGSRTASVRARLKILRVI